jgi:hypothetical protein
VSKSTRAIAGQIGFRIDQHAGRKYSSHDLIL